jgi:hypothetical protein
VQDTRLRKTVVGEARDFLPCHTALLTAALERALPEFGDKEAEGGQRPTLAGTAWWLKYPVTTRFSHFPCTGID